MPPVASEKDVDPNLGSWDPYVDREVPLSDFSGIKTHLLQPVLQSWEELGHVTRMDGTALAHLVDVLVHSVPDEAAGKGPPPLTFVPEPKPWKPTQANPRAYKGTKDRPPKLKQRQPLDLRRHLANSRDVNELILKLAPFQEEGARLLKQSSAISGDLPPLVDAKGSARDPYLAVQHREGRRVISSLPLPFRRGFLFPQRGAPWSQILRSLALYHALNLEQRAPLRRAVSRLLAGTPTALDWADRILEQPVDRRTAFTELLVESEASSRPCPQEMGDTLKKADSFLSDRFYRPGMFALLASLTLGGDTDYLLSGLELAHAYSLDHSFEPVSKKAKVPVDAIRAIVDHTTERHMALGVWSACAELDGFGSVLENGCWLDLPPKSASELIYLLANTVHDDLDPESRAAKWEVLRRLAIELAECVRGIPLRYQWKALRHLKRILYFWDRPDILEWCLREYLVLLPRLCRAPFATAGFEELPLTVLTNHKEAEWDRVRRASDEFFRKLEQACRRKNDATLISSGLYSLGGAVEKLVGEALFIHTPTILKTAKRLGGLGASVRREAIKRWKAHPLMQDGIETLSAEDLVSIVTGSLPKELAVSVPRKLKEALSGKVRLSDPQAERARRIVLQSIPVARWRLLGFLCDECVASQLDSKQVDAKALHAVRLYGNIDENRKALRGFLRAYFKGDENYLRHHPLNREWLSRQKQIDRKVWLEGMTTEAQLRDGSSITLHIELDPLEALRLGTYVGSCTGLGGSFAYSAAAIVLDLNKHVIYARSDNGAIMGRQLIAISREEQLVAFEVYPAGASNQLKGLFRNFDLEFAKRLRVDIFKPGEDSGITGKVELLLSKEWWDDCAWDLSIGNEGEEAIAGAP